MPLNVVKGGRELKKLKVLNQIRLNDGLKMKMKPC